MTGKTEARAELDRLMADLTEQQAVAALLFIRELKRQRPAQRRKNLRVVQGSS